MRGAELILYNVNMAKKSGKVKTPPQRRGAATSKQTVKKPSAAQKPVRTGRRLPPAPRRFLGIRLPAKHPVTLPSIWQLTATAGQTLWRHKRLLGGISLVYGLLNLLLVRGLGSGINVSSLRTSFDHTLGGHPGAIVSGAGTFLNLLSASNSTVSQAAAVYQLLLVLIVSLAVIWALRQALAGFTVSVRDAYYRGMYPFIPFILVFLIIGLQLIPLALGSALYSLAIGKGIAVYFIEKLAWGLLYALLALVTLYLVSASLLSVYIVTLPDMTPLKALRSARELVRGRRWLVLRKILWLPLFLLVAAAVLMVPAIIIAAPLAQWLFLLLIMVTPAMTHTYMYTLYRELLHD